MSDSSEFSSSKDSSRSAGSSFPKSSKKSGNSPLAVIDQCLASLPEGDHRIPLLYQLRHGLVEQTTASQQQEADMKKLQGVLEKLTAPANRVGTLLDQPDKGVARIMVGGAEYYANVDPRLEEEGLKVGHQILVNEAYVVIRSLGYDRNGPIVKVREILGDGRLRIDQEAGRQGILIQRANDLAGTELKVGDEVRLDPSHRIAIERLENPQGQSHLLAELPTVRWEHIGGQQEAIQAIRRSIEYPSCMESCSHGINFSNPRAFSCMGHRGAERP